MAKLEPNPSVGRFHGKIGELVYATQEDGRVIVRRRPTAPPKSTPRRQANQSRFRLAVAYVRSLREKPALLAIYKTAARIKRKRACDLALADFLNPPVVMDLDLSGYTGQEGQPIRVQALDDFEVLTVLVAIRNLQAELIEEGPAILEAAEGATWLYLSQASVPPGETIIVEVAAADRPGNKAAKAVDHACGPRPG